jgi:hypothetical protein
MEEQDGAVSRVCGGTRDRRHEREEVVDRFYNVCIGTTPVGMKMERQRMELSSATFVFIFFAETKKNELDIVGIRYEPNRCGYATM